MRPKWLSGLVRHSLHLLRVRDVGWSYQSPAPKCLDLGRRLPQRRFVAGDEYQRCAVSRQLLRGLPANPGRRSRDDDDLFSKGSGHCMEPLSLVSRVTYARQILDAQMPGR